MGFRCGIVGLPNVGKSTLFNALTETAAAQAANYPFCTIEPNVGRVAVPDERLDKIRAIAGSAQEIETQIEFVDIAGLVRGASQGEGLGNQFLANIREVDAIVHVLRCFEGGDVTHVEGRVDPIADAETVETELMLADLDSLERRVPNLVKKAQQGDKEAKIEASVLGQALELLRASKPARLVKPKDAEEAQSARPRAAADRQAGALRVQRRRSRRGRRQCAVRAGVREGRGRRRRRGRRLGRDRGRDRDPRRSRPRRLPRRPRARGNRPHPRDPRRLRVARPDHLLHRRAQGSARLDGPQGRQGARRRRARSTPTSSAASSAPRPSPTRISSPAAARRAPRTPARCAPRARNMSSRTATSCCSASTFERASAGSPGTASPPERR